MDKLSKRSFLLAGVGFLVIWHLIMSRPWSPGGGDGYWIVSKGGFYNYGCNLREVEVFEKGKWTYSCQDNWKLIDGSIPPLLATLVLVGLAIFCFIRAFRTRKG